MPNRAMEFHDSTLDEMTKNGANITLRFPAAYIHESEGQPGVDAGIGWFQEVLLHFHNASMTGSMSQLPCYIWDGRILCDGQFLHMIPVPFEYSGTVVLKLVENGELDSGQIVIRAKEIELELRGEPQSLEKFPGLGS